VDNKPYFYYYDAHTMNVTDLDVGEMVFASSSNITIEQCNFSDTGGLAFYYSSDSQVTDSIFQNNYYGIKLDHSSNIKISNSTFSSNVYGIMFYSYSTQNTIIDNIVSENEYGIYLNDESNYNNISSSKLISNDYAIYLYGNSDGNTISNCNISLNENGIYFRYACSNTFYYNNFLDNSQQIRYYYSYPYDITSHHWDNGEHGNYWSNYFGDDMDGDNIGDSPYWISGDIKDNFPLIFPYNGTILPDLRPPHFTSEPFVYDRSLTIPRDWFHIRFETSEVGFYEVIIDTDGIEGFDNSTDMQFAGETTFGLSHIYWNGTDRSGELIDDGEYAIVIWIADDHGNRIAEPHDAQSINIQKDSDRDGVLDRDDALPYDPDETSDHDGDGIGDNSDTDWDNDGWENNEDEFPWDRKEWKDTDSDGIGDNEDTDDNANGIHDLAEIPLVILIIIIPVFTIYFVNKNIIKKKGEKEESD
jgi:parallel beta-helix repeat protein